MNPLKNTEHNKILLKFSRINASRFNDSLTFTFPLAADGRLFRILRSDLFRHKKNSPGLAETSCKLRPGYVQRDAMRLFRISNFSLLIHTTGG